MQMVSSMQCFFAERASLKVREGFKKKNVKKYGLLPNRGVGEGSARVVKNQTAFLKKVFFREYLESF